MATEDIKYGDFVAVFEPYATVLTPGTQELRYCHHCLDQFILPHSRIIPCTNCTFVHFCSEHCREKSWTLYHRIECDILPILQQTGEQTHLALRMLIVAATGGDLNQIRKIIQECEHLSKKPFVLSDPVDYSHVYRLPYLSINEQNQPDILRKAITAYILTRLLTSTGFFKVRKEYKLWLKD